VRVGEFGSDARRLLEGAHRLAGKTIRCKVDPELTIEADYEALKQVVFNLMLNALEATTAGVKSLCVAQSGFECHHRGRRGPGLPASAADCLRRFHTKKNGTGLGLAVCQKIARATAASSISEIAWEAGARQQWCFLSAAVRWMVRHESAVLGLDRR